MAKTMSYQVYITASAERDIISALDYIEYFLKNFAAAETLLSTLIKQLSTLADFP
jgi:toxin ParE1/3/4